MNRENIKKHIEWKPDPRQKLQFPPSGASWGGHQLCLLMKGQEHNGGGSLLLPQPTFNKAGELKGKDLRNSIYGTCAWTREDCWQPDCLIYSCLAQYAWVVDLWLKDQETAFTFQFGCHRDPDRLHRPWSRGWEQSAKLWLINSLDLTLSSRNSFDSDWTARILASWLWKHIGQG